MPQSRRTRPSHPHLFTCTFCWHLSRGPPHVLGRAARLTCEACYDAIIDLAICWVCGEIVCRGDDRRVTQGRRVEELFRDDNDDDENDREGQLGEEGRDIWDVEHYKAKEILDIPLCANCVVEVEMDSLDRRAVVQRALRRTDKTDGGLNRNRWERKEGTISRSVTGQIRRVPSKMARVSEEPASIRTRPRSKRINAEDGAGSVNSTGSDQGNCVVPLDSTIYISILDPMGEPAFKPSPTKPIPRWMQRSSPQDRVRRHAKSRPVSILDDHFPDVTSVSARAPTPPELSRIVCPTTPSPPPPRTRTPPRRLHPWHTRISGRKGWELIKEDTLQVSLTIPTHKTSFVTSPPLKRPSSRVIAQTVSEGPSFIDYPRRQTAQTVQEEHPGSYISSQMSRTRDSIIHGDNGPTTAVNYQLPSPGTVTPPLSRRVATPSSEPNIGFSAGTGNGDKEDSPRSGSRSRTPIGNLLSRSSSPLAEAVISGLQRIVARSRTPPPQSKEYLTLYRPTTATGSSSRSSGARGRGRGRDVTDTSPSIGVAGRKRGRRVEREEFDDMIHGRQMVDADGDDDGREDIAGANNGKQLKTKRKSSLQVELRKLFTRDAT
ncbi:uncharacterized protein PG998_001858 [Apiospora kogelbergensis]|uniref:uncharacterized protein n=1 Tax=Apiospora kogelbergensis TaxID=1337665 RepID=UPI00312EBB15